jgi:pyruvate kinase
MLLRYTKIIATVGPASASEAMLDALTAAGTDIFRLNFSHGTRESQGASLARIRQAAARAGREVGVLQDLGGPKIRTGRLAGGTPIVVAKGDALRIATGDGTGSHGRLFTSFAGLAQNVRPGDRLLLADGLVELRVDATDGAEVLATVVEGGAIGEHKGINAPGVPLPLSAVTPKDVADLTYGLAHGVDMVAVSFVQSAEDLRHARALMRDAGRGDVPLIAKLERPQALEQLEDILHACDGVMVARGDLGLEIPLERVPRAQKEITRAARRRGVPVILATQVLESMTGGARPTRAEVSDAANAVADGVDAIMLAGETAVGVAPAHVVRTLDAIIRDAESTPGDGAPARLQADGHDHADALCAAAVTLAERGDAQAIVAVTRAGHTARRLSRLRPGVPVLAVTGSPGTARRLSLYWGVTPVQIDLGDEVDLASPAIGRRLTADGLVPPAATVVLVNISPDLNRPDANHLGIRRLQ